jgi:hypothetical protein
MYLPRRACVKLGFMSGGALLGLMLLSMGWLFFLGGLVANVQAVRRSFQTRGAARRGLGPLPGVVGSVTAFFSVPALARLGVDLPWPWVWILAPLVLDPLCIGGLVLLLRRP